MNDLYFGRYISRESLIHKFHPLFKFSFFLIFIIVINNTDSTNSLALYTLFFLVLLSLSKIKLSEILLVAKPFYVLIFFTFIIQLIGYSDIYNNILLCYKFLMMILISALLSVTIKPLDVVKVLYLAFRPLKILRVDVKELVLSLLIAIRFIPMLFEELNNIKLVNNFRPYAVKNRLERLNLVKRYIMPLIFRIFYYSEQLTLSLPENGVIGEVLKLDSPKFVDCTILFLLIIFLGGIFVV
ncbi:MAG: energy-coupling factor transporter transmembrane protein EcfT [Deferribacterota bacterium]|nr:energy-coupling factor transporter transmembrane protein EcfT [Deferribacterota bacterium]